MKPLVAMLALAALLLVPAPAGAETFDDESSPYAVYDQSIGRPIDSVLAIDTGPTGHHHGRGHHQHKHGKKQAGAKQPGMKRHHGHRRVRGHAHAHLADPTKALASATTGKVHKPGAAARTLDSSFMRRLRAPDVQAPILKPRRP